MNELAVVVLSTAPAVAPGSAPGKLGADALARQLVEDGLCACVNVLPGVRSHFRWRGAVDVADEHLMVIKTTRAAAPALRARLLALHPYDVPEVLELPVVGAAPDYLRWLVDAVPAAPG